MLGLTFKYISIALLLLIIGCTKEKQSKSSLEGIYTIKVNVETRLEVHSDSFAGIVNHKGRYIHPGDSNFCCDSQIDFRHGCPRVYEIKPIEIFKFRGEYFLRNNTSIDGEGELGAKHILLDVSKDSVRIPINTSFSRGYLDEYFEGVTFVEFVFENNLSAKKKGHWFIIDHHSLCYNRRNGFLPKMGEEATIELVKQ